MTLRDAYHGALAACRRHPALIAAVVIGTALRLVNIAAEPYWSDEILSLDIATGFHSAKEMLRYLGDVEFHPPLYYLVLRGWTALFGTGEAATRAASVIAAAGTTVVAYVAAGRMFGRRAAVATAFVLAVLPAMLEFGQEARPYMLFVLAGSFAMWALREELLAPRLRWQIVFAVASVIGLGLHYSYLFVYVAMASWWLGVLAVRGRATSSRDVVRFVAVNGAVIAVAMLWAVPFLTKILLGAYPIFGLERTLTPLRDASVAGDFLVGVLWMTKMGPVGRIELFSVMLAQAVLLLIAVAALRRPRTEGKSVVNDAAYLAWLVAAPIAMFALSPQSIPYTRLLERHVLFVVVPFACLLGAGLAALPKKRALVAAALLLASVITFDARLLANDAQWDYDHVLGEAAAYINAHRKEGDIVVVNVSTLRSDLGHYLDPDIPVDVLRPIGYYGLDVWRSRTTLGLIENEAQVRIQKRATVGDLEDKLTRIDGLRSPSRIWVFGLSSTETWLPHWFEARNWRTVFKAIGDAFPLELYERR